MRQPIRKELVYFLVGNAAFWAICFACEVIYGALGRKEAYLTPLLYCMPGIDFRAWITMYRHIHTDSFMTSGPLPFLYPPAAAPFQWIFSISPYPTLHFYIATVTVLMAAAAGLAVAFVKYGVSRGEAALYAVVLGLTSYPVAFCLHQGNIESFIFVLLALGVWGVLTERYTLAAVCFGVTGAAKGYPFIFLALLVTHKRWTAIGISLATAAACTLASLWLIHPNLSVAVREARYGLAYASDLQFLHRNQFIGGFDHSFLGAMKRAKLLAEREHMQRLVRAYVVTLGLAGLALYFLRLKKLPMVNQVLGVTVAAITFMPLSYDYTLLHLYIPFAMIAVQIQQTEGRLATSTYAVLGMLLIAMAPMTELMWHHTTFANVPRAFALACLVCMSAYKSLAHSLPVEARATVSTPADRRVTVSA